MFITDMTDPDVGHGHSGHSWRSDQSLMVYNYSSSFCAWRGGFAIVLKRGDSMTGSEMSGLKVLTWRELTAMVDV